MADFNLDQNIKVVNKLNNKFIDILDNPYIKYGFLIVIVIRIIFIDHMEEWYLNLLDHTSVKIIYALLVAYSACFDPVYAVALTTFIIICIQELYSRKAAKAVESNVGSNKTYTNINASQSQPKLQPGEHVLMNPNNAKVLTLPNSVNMTPLKVSIDKMPSNASLNNAATIHNIINKHLIQRIPEKNDKLIAEYDYYEDPAYKTITANISNNANGNENKDYLGHNKFYVTDKDLYKIQNNKEPIINHNDINHHLVKKLNMQEQGQLYNNNNNNNNNIPHGFDMGLGGSNPQLANITSS